MHIRIARAVFSDELDVDLWAVAWFSLLGLALSFAFLHATHAGSAIFLLAGG